MAKGYRQWVESTVPAPEPVEPPSRRAKLQNWWHYHKLHVLGAAVCLVCFVKLVYDLSGFGTVQPDVQIAYVGSRTLPQTTVEALTDMLQNACPDLNGDGQVLVQVNQYVWNTSETDSDSIQTAYAMQALLAADIENAESYFFLLEDAQSFQSVYQILALPDGSCPDEDDARVDDKVLSFLKCPVVTDGAAGSEDLFSQLGGLSLGRRCFYESNPHRVENETGCDALWRTWTGR